MPDQPASQPEDIYLGASTVVGWKMVDRQNNSQFALPQIVDS
jgi:hypothetical protein